MLILLSSLQIFRNRFSVIGSYHEVANSRLLNESWLFDQFGIHEGNAFIGCLVALTCVVNALYVVDLL